MIRMQQLTQGVDIIGKEVRYQAFGEASPDRTGVVEAVTSRQGVMYLMVNQEFVPLSSVYSVGLPGGHRLAASSCSQNDQTTIIPTF